MLIIGIITSDSGHIQILHEIGDPSAWHFFPCKSKQTKIIKQRGEVGGETGLQASYVPIASV